MIFLNNISDSIKTTHWDYFKNSIGYSKLIALSNDNNVPEEEREYFLRLTNDSILQSVILGRPEQLRKEIEYYQTYFTKIYPLLIQHQTFLSYLEWNDVYVQINQLAQKEHGKETIDNRRKEFYDSFATLINGLGDALLKNGVEEDKYTIGNIEKMYKNLKGFFKSKLGEFYDRILSVFDYDDFIKEKEDWYAYKLTAQLEVNVCPYCNRNYIHTSVGKHGKTRAELDHFYPKSKYPFLSISLYNLIPSCHVCNSNFKRAKDFYIDKHMHPYEDNHINDFCFEIVYNDDSVDSVVPDQQKFDIEFKPLSENNDIVNLINNSNNTFQIAQLHNFHKDIAQELLVRSIQYNKTKIMELKDLLGKEAGIDDEFLKRVIVGNYVDIGSFSKRPLAKFSYDILSKTDLKKNLDL